MSKQIIESISKSFNRGLELGKDHVCVKSRISNALKQEIEDAIRKLSVSSVVKADATKHCNQCNGVMYDATFCPKCKIVGSARTA